MDLIWMIFVCFFLCHVVQRYSSFKLFVVDFPLKKRLEPKNCGFLVGHLRD